MTSAADSPDPTERPTRSGVEQDLYADGSRFDFYQAVTLLRRANAEGGDPKPPRLRFETPATTAFPASPIGSVEAPAEPGQPTRVTVNFLGLTGPSGVLPRHYTERVIQVERRLRGSAKRTLRAWFDLFNNRFIEQMYRAWFGRRVDRGVIDGERDREVPDAFTNCLHSLVGIGSPPLRNRLTVSGPAGETLDRVPDVGLLHHSGTLARRQRSASQIGALLTSYFRTPIRIEQFRGQWLQLEPDDRTRVGLQGRANRLGVDAVAGGRVWDVQSRVRVKVGPLNAARFQQFLPDTRPESGRKPFAMLCQLTRLAIGMELDFDVQLILKRDDVPRLRLGGVDHAPRLGWNGWTASHALDRDGDDPVFEPIEATKLAAS